MPAAVAFSRRWKLGTDDFVFPGILDFWIKILWLTGALVVYFQNEFNFQKDEDGYFFKIYLLGLIFTLIVMILTDALVVKNSMTGGVFDEQLRVKVIPFVYIRLFIEILDVSWNILGTIWSYSNALHTKNCSQVLAFMKRYTLCNWISVLILIGIFIWMYDDQGTLEVEEKSQVYVSDIGAPTSPSSKGWEKRLRAWSCHCFRRNSDNVVNDGFKEAADILANVFKHDGMNLVSSDVFAGLISLYVLRVKEREKLKKELRATAMNTGAITCLCASKLIFPMPKELIPLPGRESLNPSLEILASSDEILLIDYYFNFVHGVHGWPIFLYNNWRKRGLKRLCSSLSCCICARDSTREDMTIEGDNCFSCHTSALMQSNCKIRKNDIVFASFKSEIYQPPFYVVLNHATKSVVVSIRGAISMKDFIVNFTSWPVSIDSEGLPINYKVHHGFLIAAQKVKSKLESNDIIDNLLKKYVNYNLVILGRSFGAGVATVLGLILFSKYPNLKVFAFSPPGNIINLEGAKFTELFTTSITYGFDLVARFHFNSIEKLKHDIIQGLKLCKTPKYQLFLDYFTLLRKKLPNIEFKNDAEAPSFSTISNSKGSTAVSGVISSTKYNQYMNMYMGGRILQISELKSWEKLPLESRWKFKWADRYEFQEIIVTPRMFADHWHFRMEKALHEFVINHCRDSFNALNNSALSDEVITM